MMLVTTSLNFTGEIDGSFDEAQFLMQASKGTDFTDLSEDLEGVPPEDRAADALFPVKATFGTTSTSLDQMRSMTRAYASVKSCNPISHYGFLSCDCLNEDVWFAEAAFARRQPIMGPQPQIREETVEGIQLIPQIIDVSVPGKDGGSKGGGSARTKSGGGKNGNSKEGGGEILRSKKFWNTV